MLSRSDSEAGQARIIQAESAEDVEAVRELFREYAESLEFGLEFQDFARELASLPGEYAPPCGRLLLALVADQPAGYRTMRLDTVPSMMAARSLYRSMGFVEIEPYRYNPIPGAIFMELKLSPPREVPSVPSQHTSQE